MTDFLSGINIIDLTRLLPGPMATHLLAQMGAHVIKIESPKRKDYARTSGPQVDGASTLFHLLNHAKELRQLDYASEEGKKELLELIARTDVLIEQFRPGAMDAWGLGYAEMKKINPKLVYLSLTGYGQTGAYAQEAGHDFNYMAYTGMMSLLKDEQGKPTVPGAQFADISGAYAAVMAIQAALLQRVQTGEGCYLDVALSDAMLPFLAVPYSLEMGKMKHEQFNLINGKTAVNYAAYRCADGKWLAVGALEVKFWNNLCEAISKPEWKRDNQMMLMHVVFPKKEVEAFFASKTREEWLALLEGKDVCVSPILELSELKDHPFHHAQGSFVPFQTPNGKTLYGFKLPFQKPETRN